MIVSEGTFFSWRCFPPSEGSFTSSFRLLLLTFRCPDSILHSNPLHPARDGAVSEVQVLHELHGSGGGRSGGGCSGGRSQGTGCHLRLKGSSVCPCQLIKSTSGVAEGPADAVKALKSVGGCSGSFQSHIPGCPPFSGDDNGGQQHQRDTGRVHLSVPWRTDLDPRQSQRASVKWQASLGIIHQRESADVRSGYSSLPGSSG